MSVFILTTFTQRMSQASAGTVAECRRAHALDSAAPPSTNFVDACGSRLRDLAVRLVRCMDAIVIERQIDARRKYMRNCFNDWPLGDVGRRVWLPLQRDGSKYGFLRPQNSG